MSGDAAWLASLLCANPRGHEEGSTPKLCCANRRGSEPRAKESKDHSSPKASFLLREALAGHANGNGFSDSGEESGSDWETLVEPRQYQRPRSGGVCAEVYGAWNKQLRAPEGAGANFYPKTVEHHEKLKQYLAAHALFKALNRDELKVVCDAVEIVDAKPEQQIIKQGDHGDALFVVLEGVMECFGEGTVPDGSKSQSTARKRGSMLAAVPKGHVGTLSQGAVFGELALLWRTPRLVSVYVQKSAPAVLGRLDAEVYQALLVTQRIDAREMCQESLRDVKLLEMLSSEQTAKLADVLEPRNFNEGEIVIRQGDEGDAFFIVVLGECVATVETGGWFTSDIQEHRRYYAGDLFGERSLLTGAPRAATITAVKRTDVLTLRRSKFERLLGPLTLLQREQYMTDPRKCIADFFTPGDSRGPGGHLQLQNMPKEMGSNSRWFAVYRPTSRDAIAKMLSGTAVGKGLNVKGKSAKKGRLSGLVPFVQISNNAHKELIEESPPDARIVIYYRGDEERQVALLHLQSVLETKKELQIEDREIKLIRMYEPSSFGLDIPEPLVREAYIMQPDLSPHIGWETGRDSMPAYMDMNMHAVREDSRPNVVLVQYDPGDPMNPHGLLLGYAEESVKPLVSDFDTFTVGSCQMQYDPLPQDQVEIMDWSLDRAEEILADDEEAGSWTAKWLKILHRENEAGFHPVIPEYGFGDPTSYNLISSAVSATISCGAVRHGAECFNFYFPQELDSEYLVVWENFPDKPWDYKSEPELRQFLLERAAEGYCFPLNPVWPIRDPGWYEVLDALLKSEHAKGPLESWFPSKSGVIQRVKSLYAANALIFQLELKPSTSDKRAFSRKVSEFQQAEIDRREHEEYLLFQAEAHWQGLLTRRHSTPNIFGRHTTANGEAEEKHGWDHVRQRRARLKTT